MNNIKKCFSFKKFKNQLTDFKGEETTCGILIASC